MKNLNIRIAVKDADFVSASSIYAASWKEAYKNILSDGFLNTIRPDNWVERFNDNYHTRRFMIAIINDGQKDIGAGGYGVSRDYSDGTWGEITSIYFLPEAWGSGYAKQLMDFMMSELGNMGCGRVHLWVVRENARACRFYEKYGF